VARVQSLRLSLLADAEVVGAAVAFPATLVAIVAADEIDKNHGFACVVVVVAVDFAAAGARQLPNRPSVNT